MQKLNHYNIDYFWAIFFKDEDDKKILIISENSDLNYDIAFVKKGIFVLNCFVLKNGFVV